MSLRSNNALLATVNLASGGVTVQGGSVTVPFAMPLLTGNPPLALLYPDSTYRVEIAAGAFVSGA